MLADVQSIPTFPQKFRPKKSDFFFYFHLTYDRYCIIFSYKQIRKMGLTKRLLEDILEEEIYPCDMDYEYQLWVENKKLQDQEEYIKNYLETKAAFEEMLADRF